MSALTPEKEVERLTLQLETTQMQRDSRKMEAEHQGRYRLAAEAKLAALVAVAEKARDRFREYARSHHDQGKFDKEARNNEMAEMLQAALSALPPPVPTEEGDRRPKWGEHRGALNVGADGKCPACGLVAFDEDGPCCDKMWPGGDPGSPSVSGSPTQAPQDVAGLVEGDLRLLERLLLSERRHMEDGVEEMPQMADACRKRIVQIDRILSALRPSPISHETEQP